MWGVSAVFLLHALPLHNTTQQHKPGQTTRKPNRTIFLEQNFSVHIKRRSTVCAAMTRTRPLNFSPPKEEMNGEEGWHMHKLTLIPIHTLKDQISEAVVGIVVFASVSSRSMDRDPSWTPCGRSSHWTCQIWPRHLAKLHAPRKTRKTSWRNYTRELGTQNCWGNHWSNQQRTLTNCSGIAQDIEWWTVRNSNSIHPNIKKRHVYRTIFFSDQGGSWHGLKCICSRVASVAQPPGVVEIWATKGQITSTAWKNNCGTSLLQLQQSHPCDWKDTFVTPKTSKTIHALWLASNLRSIRLAMECQVKDQKNRALLTQQTWIILGIFGRKIDWSSGLITFQ